MCVCVCVFFFFLPVSLATVTAVVGLFASYHIGLLLLFFNILKNLESFSMKFL